METVGRVHASQIDNYVHECDQRFGGIHRPGWLEFVSDFELEFASKVDVTLDPFSDEYFRQQLALHRELTGRELDQAQNELVPVDVSANAGGVNPYNSNDIRAISRHAATLGIALRLAAPPDGAKILDLGVGAGMSSEILAYCGAKVTAVDISPNFIDLIRMRAERLKFPIRAHLSNFDAFDDAPNSYDMALFFASLHHGLRPWDILRKISGLIKTEGKIVLAAEPIQKLWWPYWGLRLDAESVYVARKYGWFESGWSEVFLRKMFHGIGFNLDISLIDPNLIEGTAIAVGHRSPEALPEFPIEFPAIQRGSKLFFGASGDGAQYLTYGWSAASDPWGTWSSGSKSGFLLVLPPGDMWTVAVEAYPMVSANYRRQDIEIKVNGISVGAVSLVATEGAITMEEASRFEFRFFRGQVGLSRDASNVEIVFNYPLATKAQYIGRGHDPRRLAIGLVSMTLQ